MLQARFNEPTRRAAIVLRATQGLDSHDGAAQLRCGRVQVGRWRTRYAEGVLAAICQDRLRGGRRKTVNDAKIMRLNTQTKPTNAPIGVRV